MGLLRCGLKCRQRCTFWNMLQVNETHLPNRNQCTAMRYSLVTCWPDVCFEKIMLFCCKTTSHSWFGVHHILRIFFWYYSNRFLLSHIMRLLNSFNEDEDREKKLMFRFFDRIKFHSAPTKQSHQHESFFFSFLFLSLSSFNIHWENVNFVPLKSMAREHFTRLPTKHASIKNRFEKKSKYNLNCWRKQKNVALKMQWPLNCRCEKYTMRAIFKTHAKQVFMKKIEIFLSLVPFYQKILKIFVQFCFAFLLWKKNMKKIIISNKNSWEWCLPLRVVLFLLLLKRVVFDAERRNQRLHKPESLHTSLHSIRHNCITIECKEEWNFRELFLIIGGVMRWPRDDITHTRVRAPAKQCLCLSVCTRTWASAARVIFLSRTNKMENRKILIAAATTRCYFHLFSSFVKTNTRFT